MGRVEEFTLQGPSVTVLATQNGRVRVPVFVLDRVGGKLRFNDTINPASVRDRRRFLAELPEDLRDEVGDLLTKLAAAIHAAILARNTETPRSLYPAVEPWPDPVEGEELLAALEEQIARYVVLPPDALSAIALWIVHTYVTDVTDFTPYLLVTSPTRQCGKTTLLELLLHLAYHATKSDGYTAAALYRRIDEAAPTLLLDELDTRLHGDVGEALRGVLNSGFQRGGKFTICVGDDNEPRDFNTYCPKVLAGIGRPWDTVASRSIPIRIERAPKEELRKRQKIKGHLIASECASYRQRALRWGLDHRVELLQAEPEVPEELGAREADVWRPLLAIADAIGGAWPVQARAAATALSAVTEEEGDHGLLVLTDIRSVLRGRDQAATHSGENPRGIFSSDLVDELIALGESRPWSEYMRGQPITLRQLAKLLGRFSIRPRTVRRGESTKKGYHFDDLEPAFRRYLPPDETSTTATSDNPSHPSPLSKDDQVIVTDVTDVTDEEEAYVVSERRALQDGL